MSNSGESRPGLTSDDLISQNRDATGRGGQKLEPDADFASVLENHVIANHLPLEDDPFYVERVSYPLYDHEQHFRAKLVFLVIGIFAAVVLLGIGGLTWISLAGMSGDLVSGFLLTALIPLSGLVTGIGGYFFGHKAGRQTADNQ
jgi:hypothetical protein